MACSPECARSVESSTLPLVCEYGSSVITHGVPSVAASKSSQASTAGDAQGSAGLAAPAAPPSPTGSAPALDEGADIAPASFSLAPWPIPATVTGPPPLAPEADCMGSGCDPRSPAAEQPSATPS